MFIGFVHTTSFQLVDIKGATVDRDCQLVCQGTMLTEGPQIELLKIFVGPEDAWRELSPALRDDKVLKVLAEDYVEKLDESLVVDFNEKWKEHILQSSQELEDALGTEISSIDEDISLED